MKCYLNASFLSLLLMWTASASAQSPARAPLFAQWEQAERQDEAALVQGLDRRPLVALAERLVQEQEELVVALTPIFAMPRDQWIDCAKSDRALANALEGTRSPLGLEQVVVMGQKIEMLHCFRTPMAWSRALGVQMQRVRAQLPVAYAASRDALALATPEQVLASAWKQAVPVENAPCWSEVLRQSRRNGLSFPQGVERSRAQCRSASARAD